MMQKIYMPSPSRKLSHHRLSNGLEFFLKPIRGQKKITVAIGVRGGVLREKKSGLSHLTEHLIMASFEFYKNKFAKVYGNIPLSSGANVYKAYTEFRFDTKASFFIPLIKIISHTFHHPLFEEKYIAKEKRNIIKEWEKQKNLDYYLAEWLTDKAIFRAPLSNSPGGDPSKSHYLKKADVTNYWKKLFGGRNIVMVIAGNIKENNHRIINKIWSTVPNKKAFPYRKKYFFKKRRVRSATSFLPQKKILVNIKIPVLNWHSYETFVSRVASFVFAGSTTSVLGDAFKKLKIDRGIRANIFEFQKTAYIEIKFYTPAEKLNQALYSIVRTWASFCQKKSPENILKFVKGVARRLYKETIASPSLTAQMILYEKIYTLRSKPQLLPEKQLESMLKVTGGAIQKTLTAFAKPRDWTVAMVGNLKNDRSIELFWGEISRFIYKKVPAEIDRN